VHVAGYYNAGSNDVAAYWKNDASGVQGLYTSSGARALGVAVSGTDVYAAGKVDLYGTNYSRAVAIAVSGADVYASGYYLSGTALACYWKNNAAGQVDLYSDTLTSNQAQGLCIWVDGAVVYVAGQVNQGTPSACYWKDGARTDLYPGSTSVACSVCSSL